MSNIDYPPKSGNELRFNPNNFNRATDALTLADADRRYLRLSGGSISGSLAITGNLDIQTLSLNGTSVDLSGLRYITGLTAGTAAASKALVLDSGRNITGIQGLCLGTSTDTSRYFSLLVSSIAGTTLYGLTYGVDNSTNNQSEFAFYYAGSGSTSNALSLGFYSNSNILRINADQSVDIPYHNGTTGLKLGGTLITASAAELNWLDITAAGSAQASKALVVDSNRAIANVGELGFSAASQNYKTVIKKNPSTEGLYFYDTMFSTPNNTPALTLMTANRSAPIWMEFTAASISNTYQLSYNDQVGFSSGMRISCTNTGAPPLGTNQNLNLMSRNFTRLHLCVNDRGAGSIHLLPQDASELVNEFNYRIINGDNALFRKSVRIDQNADTASTVSAALNVVGNQNYLDGTSYQRVARFASSTGIILEAQISNGAQSTSTNPTYFGTYTANDLYFMTGNGGLLYLTHANKRVGINNVSPRCPLEVSGTNTTYTVTNIATTSYSYSVDSNQWLNRGGGPFTLSNLNAWFNGNIYIQTGIWATSDRRLKENIKEIDLPFERYKALRPVSYNYKNEPERKKLGFIAQEVLNVCSEAISMVPNENLKSDGDDSPEGVQLGLDYNAIIILNVNIIKKLITRIEELESTVNKLIARPVVAKWMSKNQ